MINEEQTAENEEIITSGSLNSILVKHFGILPEEIKILTAQQCMGGGLISILRARKLELQVELLNLTTKDAAELVKDYTMLRLELVLIDDIIEFLKYAGAYYTESARQ